MKRFLFVIVTVITFIVLACDQSKAPKKQAKAVKEVKKADLSKIPSELIYPGAEEKGMRIVKKDMEQVVLSTSTDFHAVSKYYRENLTSHGWKLMVKSENHNESRLIFEKGNRDALITAFPDADGKTSITVLWRLAE